MNKLYRLPLRMRSKTQLSDPRHRRKSTNPVVAGILGVGALFALAAIGLGVFGAFKHKAEMPKEVGVAPTPAVADVSPPESKVKENDAVMPLANPNPTLSSRSTNDQESSASVPVASATSSRSPSPAIPPTPTARKHEQKAETETKNPEKSIAKAARQNLEKKRQEAERKRAQLEEKYQNHEISTDAYNKGEEEYKNQIQRYRNELKSGQ
jgi:hypothetical protein